MALAHCHGCDGAQVTQGGVDKPAYLEAIGGVRHKETWDSQAVARLWTDCLVLNLDFLLARQCSVHTQVHK